MIATHGKFAEGILSALNIIGGEFGNVTCMGAYLNGNEGVQEQAAAYLEGIGDSDELIVFTDLMAGSVTNEILRCTLPDHTHIVSGINLPMLLAVMLAGEDEPIEQVIKEGVESAREQLVYINDLIDLSKGGGKNDQTHTD